MLPVHAVIFVGNMKMNIRKYRKQSWEYNRCEYCGKFKSWKKLILNFVPDTAFSSESQSTRICISCNRRINKIIGTKNEPKPNEENS